ncbi:head-tail joining protein [Muricoccus vinaceus]|uniref:Uncharacterized protein n=1 Tax=Muricoccus vinaceus TaxID=424704 RepID=A0ABV6IL47_9PROT
MVDFDALLFRPIQSTFGTPVSYLSPDGMVSLPALRGVMLRAAIPLDGDAENTGGITQSRDVLRFRSSIFPPGVEPEQGALVVVNGERSIITDVMSDPRGYYDCPLAIAAG